MSAPLDDALAAAVAEHGPFPMPVGTGPVPMTPDREQEIRAREQAATPGPWQSDGAEIYGTLGGVLMVDLWVGETLDVENQERSNADASFMADARSAVPELLAEVERLRTRVVELERSAVLAEEDYRRVVRGGAQIEAALRNRVAELKADRADRHDDLAGALGHTSGTEWPDLISVAAAATASEARPVEDPHDSPLHQTYALGHDLPEVTA
ncbi:hypothetical protein [Streptomyces sp. or3]|uniref:hypothetical protein n=1 Tax=Streptomyces sp. or3 TaxID=1828020 RepID=UPI000BFDCAA6|nr:hypothetical protein [Streptomyces sp. or3]